MTRPSPPKHLSTEARDLWKRLHDGHAIDDAGGLALLNSACESFDLAEQARALMAAEGLTLQGRQGPKPHPAAMIRHNAIASMHSALRLLRLSPEDTP